MLISDDAWLLNYEVLERHFFNPLATLSFLVQVVLKLSLELFIDIKDVIVGFVFQETLDGGHHDLLINRRCFADDFGAELVSRLDF